MVYLNQIKKILTSNNTNEELFKSLNEIAWTINYGIGFLRWERRPFDYSSDDERFCEYMFSWHIFASRGIPFNLWSDIAEEGLALLKEMIETGNFDYEKSPKYKEFRKHFYECADKIRSDPQYHDRFGLGY